MSLVRFALLALLGAHGGVTGLVRPTQPVAHRIHAETKHASSPVGKNSLQGPHEVSKKTAAKQTRSPHASTISKQGELAAHEGVAGAKHSRQPVVHKKFAEPPIVKLSAWKTSLKDPLDDDANKLGEAYARAFGKKTAAKQTPNPHASMNSKKGKLAAHEGVASGEHSKQPVEAQMVKLSAWKSSSQEPLDENMQKLGEAYAREFGEKPSPKTGDTSEVSSTQLQGNGDTSTENPKRLSAKPLPVQIQDRLSDNAEHMIEAAMDSDPVDGF